MKLNHEEIRKNLQKIKKNKPFLSKYKWEVINFPLEKDVTKNVKK